MTTRRKVVNRNVIDLSGKIEERDLQKLASEYIEVNKRRSELKKALTKGLMARPKTKRFVKTDLGEVNLSEYKTRSIDPGKLYNHLPKNQRHLFKEVVSVNVKQASDMFGSATLRKIIETGKSLRLKIKRV